LNNFHETKKFYENIGISNISQDDPCMNHLKLTEQAMGQQKGNCIHGVWSGTGEHLLAPPEWQVETFGIL
jgi:hypothetical protein